MTFCVVRRPDGSIIDIIPVDGDNWQEAILWGYLAYKTDQTRSRQRCAAWKAP